jgi:hypothetical protein
LRFFFGLIKLQQELLTESGRRRVTTIDWKLHRSFSELGQMLVTTERARKEKPGKKKEE